MNTEPTHIRLVALDLDGTLLRSDGSISTRTLDALAITRAASVEVVFVTARPPRRLREAGGTPPPSAAGGLSV